MKTISAFLTIAMIVGGCTGKTRTAGDEKKAMDYVKNTNAISLNDDRTKEPPASILNPVTTGKKITIGGALSLIHISEPTRPY